MENLNFVAVKNTLIAIEVPYVTDMLEGVEFDTIYHEHLSYVSVRSVERLLQNSNFHLHKVLRFHIHGGAIVLMLRRNDTDFQPDASVAKFLELEQITIESWNDFSNQTAAKIAELQLFVCDRAFKRTETICGFGASAKSTVWINACGFTEKHIDFICDCTPSKQGKLSPGTGIPIVSESELMARRPGHAVLFAWNFKAEIIRNNQAYLNAGGHFVIPGKVIEIV
jgi:novobiocin biosynthesis protein NovU/D-mycarose 3-C-methyltransferase